MCRLPTMCRLPRIPADVQERTARRSVPATFVGCVIMVPTCFTRFPPQFPTKMQPNTVRIYLAFAFAAWSTVSFQAMGFPVMGSANANAAEAINFDRDIRPILSDHCFTCHGPDNNKRQAGLRLDQKEAAFSPVESGDTAIVAGQVGSSELIHRITSTDDSLVMPPPGKGKPLSKSQVELLSRWISEGATWSNHWAFEPVKTPTVPVDNLAAGSVANPIDAFVLRRLHREGLSQSPRESKERLLRRLSLDLTGLPPTLQDVDAFLQDTSANAIEKVVDRLLESPHFGERMAMPWLDLARYGDTSGYHNDSLRDMWLWREWVVKAFNANMPFDQFTTEQLSGDLIPNATIQQQIASGFHRNVMTSDEGGLIDAEYRNLYVVDRVATTGVTWLGLTIACAQCHDHKYDPTTQEDFYRLYAFFNNVPETGKDGVRDRNPKPFLRVPSEEQSKQLRQYEEDLADASTKLEALTKLANEKQTAWEAELVAAVQETPPSVADAHFPLESSGDSNPIGEASITAESHGKPKFVDGLIGKSFQSNAKTWFEYGDRFAFEKDEPFSVSANLFVTSKGGAPYGKMDDKNGAKGWDLEFHGLRPSVHLIHQWPKNAIHIQAEQDVVADTFTNITFTYDGSGKAAGLKLYVNGVLAKASVKEDGLTESIRTTTPFSIGRRGNASTPFEGRIDEVQIFKRELTPAEVTNSTLGHIRSIASISVDKRDAKQKSEIEKFFRETQYPEYSDQLKAKNALQKTKDDFENSIPNTMVMSEMDKPRDTFIKIRGSYDQDGTKVEAAGLSFLPPIKRQEEGKSLNRLQLSQWLTSAEHPLTSRVAVNRWWTILFGTGIVKTTNDFGIQGERPSHPELLDWLAADFKRDWDIKRAIKQIVMSATYQQTSRSSADLQSRDQENRMLARGPRQRLDAELLRDNALTIAGILNPAIGGKSIKPYQPEGTWEINEMSGYKYEKSKGTDLYRRGLYVYWRRSTVYPSFVTLDAPTREFCQTQRAKTSTPLQSLVLMNDPVFVEAARAMAQRILSQPNLDRNQRLELAWRFALARRPLAQESGVLQRTLDRQLATYRADPAAAKSLASVGDLEKPASLDDVELAAWTALCNVLLNLNETISN